MSFAGKAKNLGSFIWSQVRLFIDIFLLKLRIFGFADKQSGLFTRLGETVHKARSEGRVSLEDEAAVSIIGEIDQSREEISNAEKEINNKKEQSRLEREAFLGKTPPAEKPEPGQSQENQIVGEPPAAPKPE